MNKIRITSLAVCGAMGFAAHAQNLLLNGSFESPSIPANSFQRATPTSWIWSGPPALIHNGNSGDPFVWPLPEEGQQFGDIGNESFFALSQPFTITNEGFYVLNWFDSAGHAGVLTSSPYSVVVLSGAFQ